MSFLYPFLNFLQPGVLFPVLAPFKPMLVASLLAAAFALRTGTKDLAEQRRVYFTHPAFKWLCVFVFLQVISVYYSGVGSMIGEFSFWDVYLFFLVTSLLCIRDARTLRLYVWGMMLGSAVVIGTGLVLVATHSPALAGGRAGAYGMYENHNDYTFIIIMVLPFAYLCRRYYTERLARFVLLLLIVGCVLGTLLSLSRGGILALVAECGMIIWMTTSGKRRMVAIIAVGVIGSAAVVYQFAARAENQGSNYTEADAENSRYELWRAARSMYFAHPILGIGSRRFSEYAQEYGEISHDNRGKVAHNTYIEILADTGTLGFGAFALMLTGILRSVRDARLTGVRGDGIEEIKVAIFISLVSIMLRSLLDAKAIDWSYYTLAALAIATATLSASKSSVTQQTDAAAEPGPALATGSAIATAVSASRGGLRRPMPVSARPMIYRRQR